MEVLFLLLPVAAASGWWLARRSSGPGAADHGAAAPAFFRGLNYLLDEQPDKAIDVFLKLAEVDTETAETHLALASLFRRRGEVDRAIRIHQNLIARDNLTREQRTLALFELGQDYMRAGLLDRAELLFDEVAELGTHRERALRGLLDIYQQERDWAKCLETAERLKPLTERPLTTEIAQYHCELAEDAARQGDTASLRRHLTRAQAADPRCVRATLIEGRLSLESGDPQRAMDLLLRVVDQGPAFTPEILPTLTKALAALGQAQAPVLASLASRQPSPPLMLALADALAEEQGVAAAMDALIRHLAGYVDLASLERLLDLEGRAAPEDGTPEDGATAERARVLLGVVRHLLAGQSAYRCDHCGFFARSLHWQCPSCQRWGTLHPVQSERIPLDQVPSGPRLA